MILAFIHRRGGSIIRWETSSYRAAGRPLVHSAAIDANWRRPLTTAARQAPLLLNLAL
jgi:hypothetical protein